MDFGRIGFLKYSIKVRNLTENKQEFILFVNLYAGEGSEGIARTFSVNNISLLGAPFDSNYSELLVSGNLDVGGLTSGIYTVRFDLYADRTQYLQDTRFISFCVA